MFTVSRSVVFATVAASLLIGGAAAAQTAGHAPKPAAGTTWAPPAEIAPKAQQTPSAGAAPVAAAPAADSAAKADAGKPDKAKDCGVQADAKGLHGKARKKFRADCEKG